MDEADIKKKFKRSYLLLRIWFWAAVHSPYFRHCQLYLSRPPMRTNVYCRGNNRTLLMQITFNCPELTLNIPCHVRDAFLKATQEQCENIDLELTQDDIPF
jgi:hypothetical protein